MVEYGGASNLLVFGTPCCTYVNRFPRPEVFSAVKQLQCDTIWRRDTPKQSPCLRFEMSADYATDFAIRIEVDDASMFADDLCDLVCEEIDITVGGSHVFITPLVLNNVMAKANGLWREAKKKPEGPCIYVVPIATDLCLPLLLMRYHCTLIHLNGMIGEKYGKSMIRHRSKQVAEAVCSALHPRLGAGSPLSMLSQFEVREIISLFAECEAIPLPKKIRIEKCGWYCPNEDKPKIKALEQQHVGGQFTQYHSVFDIDASDSATNVIVGVPMSGYVIHVSGYKTQRPVGSITFSINYKPALKYKWEHMSRINWQQAKLAVPSEKPGDAWLYFPFEETRVFNRLPHSELRARRNEPCKIEVYAVLQNTMLYNDGMAGARYALYA